MKLMLGKNKITPTSICFVEQVDYKGRNGEDLYIFYTRQIVSKEVYEGLSKYYKVKMLRDLTSINKLYVQIFCMVANLDTIRAMAFMASQEKMKYNGNKI